MSPGVAVFTGSRAFHTVCIAIPALALMVGCSDKKDKPASQTAVKVNNEEITVHQINFALQQQRGLKAEQVDQASRQILERLIDQELARQRAEELKLDREPRVVQQLEATKREIVARAYVERIGEAAARPTPEEVQKYYEENPVLFKDRRIYSIQELTIEAAPEQVQGLREKLNVAKNISEFIEMLKASDVKFSASQSVRAAEQLPLDSLNDFAKMRDGQSMLRALPTGVQVNVLASSRSQPVSLDKARPAIEQFLLNERKRELVTKDIKAMRDAAKIKYVGKYAEGAASAPLLVVTAPASTPAASGGLSEDDINKGLGLKK